MSSKTELIEILGSLVRKYNPYSDLLLGLEEEVRRVLPAPPPGGPVRVETSREDFENAIREMEVDIEMVLKKTSCESV